jgi:hypothetical protein
MKFDSHKSTAFETTMNVMESQFQSQLQQEVYAKVAGPWNQVRLLPDHAHAYAPKLQKNQGVGASSGETSSCLQTRDGEESGWDKSAISLPAAGKSAKPSGNGLSSSMSSSGGSCAAKSSLDAPSDNG